jgi:hypothetical protein
MPAPRAFVLSGRREYSSSSLVTSSLAAARKFLTLQKTLPGASVSLCEQQDECKRESPHVRQADDARV